MGQFLSGTNHSCATTLAPIQHYHGHYSSQSYSYSFHSYHHVPPPSPQQQQSQQIQIIPHHINSSLPSTAPPSPLASSGLNTNNPVGAPSTSTNYSFPLPQTSQSHSNQPQIRYSTGEGFTSVGAQGR